MEGGLTASFEKIVLAGADRGDVRAGPIGSRLAGKGGWGGDYGLYAGPALRQDQQMPVPIRSTPLVYFPVPKVACTSLKRAIHAHNDPDEYAKRVALERSGHGFNIHGIYRSRRMYWWRFLPYVGKKWFCVIRDPIERFVSAHESRVVTFGELSNVDGLPCNPDLETFARNLPAYCLVSTSIRHQTKPMTNFLGRWPGLYDRIFRLDQIADLKAYVMECGAVLDIGHFKNSNRDYSEIGLSAASLSVLREFYCSDYEAFGRYL